MQKSLFIDPVKCTGCLQCEMACSYENTGTLNPSLSRIKVFSFEEQGRKVPYTCTQCDEAWLMGLNDEDIRADQEQSARQSDRDEHRSGQSQP